MIVAEPYRELRAKDSEITDDVVRLSEKICERHNLDPFVAVPLKRALCEVILRIVRADL